MSAVDIVVQSDIDSTPRVRQIGSMFDCPVERKQSRRFSFDFPYDAEPWDVGLVVGPSGSGKSTVVGEVFGGMPHLDWTAKSVIDDFDKALPIGDVAKACQSVGFNTIPAWMRPFRVLSNGEQFRVDAARRILELPVPVVLDEFTSVVDRQVAQIGAHAVQKYARRHGKQVVAATCHYDVVDWLQPDWVLDMATCSFQRRRLQRRPELHCTIARVPYAAWSMFAPYHYMSARLNPAARCYGLWAENQLASFAAVLPQPHPRVKNVIRGSRVVTLPDWQGLGLIMVLTTELARAYTAVGKRFRMHPAHPAFVRAFAGRREWVLKKKPGVFSPRHGRTSTVGAFGGRPCAVWEWVGDPMPESEARRLLGI